jgi:hypothetical protein
MDVETEIILKNARKMVAESKRAVADAKAGLDKAQAGYLEALEALRKAKIAVGSPSGD